MFNNQEICGQPFTKEKIELAAGLLARSSISLMDVRKHNLTPDAPLPYYRLPTSALICTRGTQASVSLDRLSYQADRFAVFHGGRGSELSIHPHDRALDVYLVLYTWIGIITKRVWRRLVRWTAIWNCVQSMNESSTLHTMRACCWGIRRRSY